MASKNVSSAGSLARHRGGATGQYRVVLCIVDVVETELFLPDPNSNSFAWIKIRNDSIIQTTGIQQFSNKLFKKILI